MSDLRPHQKMAKEAVKWLLDINGNLGSGRTELMAHCFIEIAIEHKNSLVEVWDHGSRHHRHKGYMMERVYSIWRLNYEEGISLDARPYNIVVNNARQAIMIVDNPHYKYYSR